MIETVFEKIMVENFPKQKGKHRVTNSSVYMNDHRWNTDTEGMKKMKKKYIHGKIRMIT